MDIHVSVAMAIYNGEKYMEEQIASILKQLDCCDELVLSVDPSSDRSEQLARQFADTDSRVVIVNGPGQGAIKNFENALKHVNGSLIFLSDQDDRWARDKLPCCLNVLQKDGVMAIVHDGYITDNLLNVQKESIFNGTFHAGALHNIIRNRYIGCCMAFKRELLKQVLPFPSNLPMHDQWIGILANRFGSVEYINRPLIYYRRHENTATGRQRANILLKLKWRVNIIGQYLIRRKRDV